MVCSLTLPRFMHVGSGAIDMIGAVLESLEAKRPFVVTDPFLLNSGHASRVVEALQRHGLAVEVFSETVPDPTTESLAPGVLALKSHGADVVIGFGGGSPMDTAKALAVLAVAGGPMSAFKAPNVYSGPALPVVAVPTTAGSGSEVTQFAVITDSATDEKMLCTGRAFLPLAAIVDYELTVAMPARLTADTGIDALTHAVEAYVSRKANPFSDGLCLTAIRAIASNLRRVYADGNDLAAREAMMLAATQAGIAFSNSSVALIHGMSRPVGAHFHVAHGLSNAMLFPAITRYSVDGATARYADCARAMNLAAGHDSDTTAAVNFVDGVEALCHDLSVPTPAKYGIARSDWERLTPVMAQQALASGSPSNNPLVPDVDTIEELYARVYA